MEPGIALHEFLDHKPGTKVALWCIPCGAVQKLDMAAVVARLDARGIDGRQVGIRELPRYLTRRCPSCGANEWDCRPDFPPAPMGVGKT